MKQGVRFFLKPQSFINQLQWSSNHWAILALFLILATVETQLGSSNALYHTLALYLHHRWSISLDLALWTILAAKLAFFLVAAFALTTLIYMVGSVVGTKSSRRVLARRLAVVFTVILAGFTIQHLIPAVPQLMYVSLGLYIWGLVLGYVAIREQFGLNHFATLVMGVFAILAVSATWQLSNRYFETSVRTKLHELARQNAPRPGSPRFKMPTF